MDELSHNKFNLVENFHALAFENRKTKDDKCNGFHQLIHDQVK